MLLTYFSRVFLMSRSCGCSRWTFSSSCSFFSWQPCSLDTLSFSLLSMWSSWKKSTKDFRMNSITIFILLLNFEPPDKYCFHNVCNVHNNARTSAWEISVPIEEPILPFSTLPPPVIVPVMQENGKKIVL